MFLSTQVLTSPTWLQVEQYWSLWQPSFMYSNTIEFQYTRQKNLTKRLWYHQQIKRTKPNNKFYLDIEQDLISDTEDDDDDSIELTFEKKKDITYQPISLLTEMLHKPQLKRCQAKTCLDTWFSSIIAEK